MMGSTVFMEFFGRRFDLLFIKMMGILGERFTVIRDGGWWGLVFLGLFVIWVF